MSVDVPSRHLHCHHTSIGCRVHVIFHVYVLFVAMWGLLLEEKTEKRGGSEITYLFNSDDDMHHHHLDVMAHLQTCPVIAIVRLSSC